MWFPRKRKTDILRVAAILSMAGLAATCQFDPGSKPDTFSFPGLADSLTRFDSTLIILKDGKGNPIDTIFRGRVHDAGDLVKLEAPHYKGGKTWITIVGFEGKKEAYQVDRSFDPNHQSPDSVRVRSTPFSSIKLSTRNLEIPVKTTIDFPIVTIEPKELLDKRYTWASEQEKLVQVEAGGLRGLAVGSAYVIVSLVSESSKKDTLTVTVTARPALPDSIRLHPDSLVVAAGGRPFPFTLEAFPSGASKKVDWSLSPPKLATISLDGWVQGLAKGRVTVKAVSREDSVIVDSARLQILDPIAVEALRFLQDSIEIFEGGTPGKLDYEVTPLLASPAVRYQIADSAIVSIEGDRVMGMKEGVTMIVGISQDSPAKKDSLKTIVLSRQKVDSIQAFADTLRLYLGTPPALLSAKVFPIAAAQKVDWKSLDTTLVRVDAAGKATPLAAGKTMILTFARADSSKQDRIVALIRKDTPLLTLGRADTTVPEGATVLFHPKAPQEYGKVTRFEWDFDGDGNWDGASDSLQDIPHLFSAAGDFPARFRVQDTEGNDTLVTKKVHVVVGPVILILQPPDQFQTNQKTIDVAWSVDAVEQTGQKKETLLRYGANTITRTAKDSAGNVYSTSITVYWDTLPPAKPNLVGPTPVNTKTPTWTWTSGGNGGNGSYRYWMDNEDPTSARSIKDTAFTPATDLIAGTHTFFLQERDDAGNWSPTSRSAIVIDLTPPAPPVAAAGFIPLTNNTKPSWVWSRGGGDGIAVFRYRLDNNDLSQGTTTVSAASFAAPGNLAEGPHTLYLQERDSAGNWSSTAPLVVRIDLTPPASPSMDSTPYSPLNTLRPTWTWKGGGGGMGMFRCKIDDANLNAGADTVTSTACKAGKDYSEGPHTLYVQERDSAGNWSGSSLRTILIALRKVIGQSPFSDGAINFYAASLHINPAGTPIAFFNDGTYTNPVIKKFQSNAWVDLGSPSTFMNQHFQWSKSMAISPQGVPYILLLDTADRPSVYHYAQGQWELVGPRAFTTGSIGEASLAISQEGIPLVAYRDDEIQKTTVRKFNGTAWELVGPRGFSNGFTVFHNLVLSKSGIPYVAYIGDGDSLNQNPIAIRRFSIANNYWERLTSPPIHSEGNNPFHFAIGKDDTLYLAIITSESKSLEVYKQYGSFWNKVGNAINGPLSATSIGFSISQAGQLFVSYRDGNNGNRITVKTFKNDFWIPVGPLGFSSEVGEDLMSGLAIDSQGIPLVFYGEFSNSNRATVIQPSFDP